MRLIESRDRLVLRDVPGVLWVFGLVFVASGSFVLTAPFWADEWRDFGVWQRLAMLAIGVAHVGGGLFTAGQPRATVTELDRAKGRGAQRVRRFWSRWDGASSSAPAEFPLGDVRAVEVVRSKDGDGDPVFQVRLRLAQGESLWLQAQPASGEARATENAERVRRFLGLGGTSTSA
jgi:hypothetical protein